MERPISALMEAHVATVKMDSTVESLQRALAESRLSRIPVVDPQGDVYCIVSASDIELFRTQKRDPKRVRAWELCNHPLIKVTPDQTVRDVARLMIGKGVPDAIVMSGDRTVHGTVSSLDIMAELLRLSSGQVEKRQQSA